MSAIQIVCAVAVPLLWGYQFVAIKVGVMEFPPLFFLALRFLAIALLLIPFVKRPTAFRPYRSYFSLKTAVAWNIGLAFCAVLPRAVASTWREARRWAR